MKLKINEMSFSRKEVRRKLEFKFNPVAEHLAKIFVHQSSQTDRRWKNEIKGYFQSIINFCNNLKRKKAIKRDHLIEAMKDFISFDSIDCISDVYYNKKYEKMKKIYNDYSIIADYYESNVEIALNKVMPMIADLILQDDESNIEKMADILVSIIKEYREKFITTYKKK